MADAFNLEANLSKVGKALFGVHKNAASIFKDNAAGRLSFAVSVVEGLLGINESATLWREGDHNAGEAKFGSGVSSIGSGLSYYLYTRMVANAGLRVAAAVSHGEAAEIAAGMAATATAEAGAAGAEASAKCRPWQCGSASVWPSRCSDHGFWIPRHRTPSPARSRSGRIAAFSEKRRVDYELNLMPGGTLVSVKDAELEVDKESGRYAAEAKAPLGALHVGGEVSAQFSYRVRDGNQVVAQDQVVVSCESR